MNVAASTRHAGSDHRFFVLAAVGVLAIVIVGFARSYYLKTLFGTPALPLLCICICTAH